MKYLGLKSQPQQQQQQQQQQQIQQQQQQQQQAHSSFLSASSASFQPRQAPASQQLTAPLQAKAQSHQQQQQLAKLQQPQQTQKTQQTNYLSGRTGHFEQIIPPPTPTPLHPAIRSMQPVFGPASANMANFVPQRKANQHIGAEQQQQQQQQQQLQQQQQQQQQPQRQQQLHQQHMPHHIQLQLQQFSRSMNVSASIGSNVSASSPASTNSEHVNLSDRRALLNSKFPSDIVDQVLSQYKDETDKSKLLFYAEGLNFDL